MGNVDDHTDMRENRFPSGELESQGNFVYGRQVGRHQRWHRSGRLFSEIEYKDCVMDGVIREWDESGQMTLCANLCSGELHGKCRNWWKSGSLKEDGEFRMGKRVGKYVWCKSNGSVWRELDFPVDTSE